MSSCNNLDGKRDGKNLLNYGEKIIYKLSWRVIRDIEVSTKAWQPKCKQLTIPETRFSAEKR